MESKAIYDLATATRELIAPYVRVTPLLRGPFLRDELHERLILKLENTQVTGSFKIRGAFNNLLQVPEARRAKGVVAASGGNHGLAVAFAGWRLGVPVTIFLPNTATEDRKQRIAQWGAHLELAGTSPSDALKAARQFAAHQDVPEIHPFAEERTIAGTAALGLEIYEQIPDIDCAIIAVGGGGLIAGIAGVLKHLNPKVHIIGVEPVGAATLFAALQVGSVVQLPEVKTFADTLAPRSVAEINLECAKRYVDEMVIVSDSHIYSAMQLLWRQANQLVEPAGAAVLAALQQRFVDVSGYKNPLALICGGNIDARTTFESYIEKQKESDAFLPGRYPLG